MTNNIVDFPKPQSDFPDTASTQGENSPSITQAALQQLPEMAGTVSAASSCLAMTAGSTSGALTAVLFDGCTALSMTSVMTFCAFLALICFWTANRHTEHRAIRRPTEA